MATWRGFSRGDVAAPEGSIFDGRFRVERHVAEGGFAVVYKAFQVALDRWVALKILKESRTNDETARAEFADRFATEAKTIARLRHPHIVDVYDFGVSTLPNGDLVPWMALEWLDGETLATRLARRRAEGEHGLEPGAALALLRPVLEALAHAHDQGIAHRDIKPSNVMVVGHEGGESLRVLDFGIAKIVARGEVPETGNTRTESAPAFSPAYAAPEQVAFSRTGPWTDVHALGLLLVELMTDQAPFSEPDPDAHMFEQVMDPRRPTPARKGRDVGAFEPVLARALALSPRDRWRNARELLAALDEAARRSAGGETRSKPRRARAAIGLASLATVFAIGIGWARSVRDPRSDSAQRVSAVPALVSAQQAPTTALPAPPPPAALARPAAAPVDPPLPRPERRRRRATPQAAPVEPAQRSAASLEAPAVPPPVNNDGRGLFDDTK